MLSQGEAFAHFLKPHSEFFCESQLIHHWAIAAVPKKKQWQNTWGGGGMGSMDWLNQYNYRNSLIYIICHFNWNYIYIFSHQSLAYQDNFPYKTLSWRGVLYKFFHHFQVTDLYRSASSSWCHFHSPMQYKLKTPSMQTSHRQLRASENTTRELKISKTTWHLK